VPTASCRPANLVDVMILVGAGAIALTITRTVDPAPPFNWAYLYLRVAFFIEKYLLPWLIALSWAMMAIRLRWPRPSLRRLWRQPGAIASVMIVLTTVLVGSQVVARINTMPRAHYANMFRPWEQRTEHDLYLLFFDASMLIAGAWVALVLTRRMRCEPGWIDGLGTVVGATWIVARLIFTTCMIVYRD
jgi:hypothetical protein